MTREQMSSADAAWLRMDRPTNLMVITSVMWFRRADRSRGPHGGRARTPRRALRALPPAGRGVARAAAYAALGGRPGLRPRHIHHRALPAPGGDAELEELVSDLMATPLDHSKPLWDLYVVDGFRGGSALVSRMHHCIADGIALARVMLSLADEQRDTGIAPAPRPGRAPRPRRARASGAAAAARRRTPSARSATRASSWSPPRARRSRTSPARPARRPRARQDPAHPGGRRDGVQGKDGRARRAAWSGASTSTRSRRSATRAGRPSTTCSSTALTGNLRDYLRGASLVDHVRAFVPFNLRPLDQPLPSTLGNASGSSSSLLPVGIASTRERLRSVKAEMDAIKRSAEGPWPTGSSA